MGAVGTEGADGPLEFEETPETLPRLKKCQL